MTLPRRDTIGYALCGLALVLAGCCVAVGLSGDHHWKAPPVSVSETRVSGVIDPANAGDHPSSAPVTSSPPTTHPPATAAGQI